MRDPSLLPGTSEAAPQISVSLTVRSWRVSRAAVSDVFEGQVSGEVALALPLPAVEVFLLGLAVPPAALCESRGSGSSAAPAGSQGCSASHLGCRGVQFSSANRNDLKYWFPVLR